MATALKVAAAPQPTAVPLPAALDDAPIAVAALLFAGVVALQPISQKPAATALCIETCIARNWRFSMQTHKYLNIA